MTDPFSVTGSAVGVVSLGLTLCQGFLAYYGPYKSFHEEIDEILSRIWILNDLLITLHEAITESHPALATRRVHLATRNIETCQQGLEKLQKMLEKCHRICPHDREKSSRLKSQYDRLLYPFRRETLMKLVDTVAWLQSNVDSALQILEISMLNSSQQSMELVLSNTVTTASNTHKLISGLQTLENQHSTIHSTLTMLVQRIDQVESHIKANSGQPIITPKLLKSLLDKQQENDKSIAGLLTGPQRRNRTKKQLRCRCDPMGAEPTFHRAWCPLHNQSRDLMSLVFRHTFCNRFLRFSVTASLTMTKGAGGFSLSPNLQFRAVVSEDSPGFSLLYEHLSRNGIPKNNMIDKSEIRKTHKKLFELFHTGLASPTDTLQNGNTILHVVARWQGLNDLWDEEGWADWHAFIDDILATGVSVSSINEQHMTPADVILRLYEVPGLDLENPDPSRPLNTAEFCVKLLKAGSYITSLPFLPGTGEYVRNYRFTQRRGRAGQNMNTLAIPLIQSIVATQGMQDIEMPDELQPLISQSVDELHSLLHGLGILGPEASPYFDFYAQWPTGLSILLNHGYTPTDDALYHAIYTDSVPSLKMMLDCDRFSMGAAALSSAGKPCDDKPEIRKLIIEAFANRRRRLQALAETQLPASAQAELNLRPETLLNRKAARACQLLQSYAVDVSGIEASEAYCVYFTRSMGLGLWNELWNAGFRDVDEVDEGGKYAGEGTALMWCGAFDSRRLNLTVLLEGAEWLVSRGADLYRRSYGTPAIPAIHKFAYWMAMNMAERVGNDTPALSEERVQLLHLILLDDYRDHCDCPCCAGGCFAFKRLLHEIFKWMKRSTKAPVWIKLDANPLSTIFRYIQRTLTPETTRDFYDKLAARVIRYLTFCELDLTHTCGHDGEPIGNDRISEIHEEEASLIAQLECLVDELIEIYRASSLELHQFLKDVWREQMDKILSEMPDDRDAAELRYVGVTFHPFDRKVSWCNALEGTRAYYPPH